MKSLCPLRFSSALFLASIVGQVLCAPNVDASDAFTPLVDLGYAKYQGVFNTSANATFFLGIRYAAPPLGKLNVCTKVLF